MKKYILLIAAFFILLGYSKSQNVLLVGWTFPVGSLLADQGLNLIEENAIITMGGTSSIILGTGYTTNAAMATGWDLGMDTKAWAIRVKTLGYHNITVSSRQYSGSQHPGPKKFELQYSINYGGSWSPVVGGEITVDSDWSTSRVNKLPLTEGSADQDEVWIRWVMMLNTASGTGGAVQEDGESSIDEIFIYGDQINSVEDHFSANIDLYPNPVHEKLCIKSSRPIGLVEIIDLSGNPVYSVKPKNFESKLDVSFLPNGLYIVKIADEKLSRSVSKKVTVNR
ncbi:MAG: T9SS type A sorting domain-containing protein [Bacteroidales bacterium]|nr:T9SS type A sorting domain-containing protein [Bacteroidales bacterium]